MEKVSVVIATCNGVRRGFLGSAIESVLNQTYQNFELIIIDDGSTDNTKEFCKQYLSNSKVKYVYQENRGISAARNKGIKESCGEYVCFLDDDDIWLPEKLEKQIALFNNTDNPKLGMVHTWVEFIDEKKNYLGVCKHKTCGDIYKKLFTQNIINAASSVMIKKNVFKVSGMFREHMIHVDDYELWFRIAKHFDIYSVDEVLVRYHVHNQNESKNYQEVFYYSQLAFYYALKGNKDINENKVYNKLNKLLAIHQFTIKDYEEFRKYYKFAKIYGAMGLRLQLRYWISYFPGVVGWIRNMKQLTFKNLKNKKLL